MVCKILLFLITRPHLMFYFYTPWSKHNLAVGGTGKQFVILALEQQRTWGGNVFKYSQGSTGLKQLSG